MSFLFHTNQEFWKTIVLLYINKMFTVNIIILLCKFISGPIIQHTGKKIAP